MSDNIQATTEALSSEQRCHVNQSLTFCNSRLFSSSINHVNVVEPRSLPSANPGLHPSTLPTSSVCGYRYRESLIQHQPSVFSEQIDDPDAQVVEIDDLLAFCNDINLPIEEPRHTTFDLADLRLGGDEIRIVESSPLSAIENIFSINERNSEQRHRLHNVSIGHTHRQYTNPAIISRHDDIEASSTTAPAYVHVGPDVESFQSVPQSTEKWSTVSAPPVANASPPFWGRGKSRSKRRKRNGNTTAATGVVEDSFRKGSIISMLRAKFQHGRDTSPHADSDHVAMSSNGTPVSGTQTPMSSPSPNTTRTPNRVRRWHWRRFFRRLNLRHSSHNENRNTPAEGSLAAPNVYSPSETESEHSRLSSPSQYDPSPSICTDNNSSTHTRQSNTSVQIREADYNKGTILFPANISTITSSMVTVPSTALVESSKHPPDNGGNTVERPGGEGTTMNAERKPSNAKTSKSVSPVVNCNPAVDEVLKSSQNSFVPPHSKILPPVSDKSKHLSLPITPDHRHAQESETGVPHSFCGSIQTINVSRAYMDRQQRNTNAQTQPNESPPLALVLMPDRRRDNGNAQHSSQRGHPRISQHETGTSRMRKNIGVGASTGSGSSMNSTFDESRKGFGPRLSLLLFEGLSSLELKNKPISSMVKNMRRMGNGGNILAKDESSGDLQSPWGVQNDEVDDSNVNGANLSPVEQFKKALKIGPGAVGVKKKNTDDDNDDICSIDTSITTMHTQRNRNCSGAENWEGDVDASNPVLEMSRDEFVDFITSGPNQKKRPKWTAGIGIKK